MTNGAGGDIAGYFRTGYEAIGRFPVLVAPPLLAGVLALVLGLVIFGGGAVMGALMGVAMGGGGGGMAAGSVVGLIIGGLVFVVVMGLLSQLSSCVVVVMARDALAGREPVLGDAVSAVMARLGPVLVASALVTVITMIGFLLLFIPGLIAIVLLMFTMPAVLLEGLGATDALRRSVAVVRANLGPVIGLVVGALLVLIGVGIASWILSLVPFLGGLASFVLHGVALSYLTVVAVGFYQALPRA